MQRECVIFQNTAEDEISPPCLYPCRGNLRKKIHRSLCYSHQSTIGALHSRGTYCGQ